MKLNVAYNPQQYIGVEERKNRTLIEMASSMLQIKKLRNMYWVDVVQIGEDDTI